jgi:hydroxypyruvate isomerase
MPQFSANLTMLFTEADFLERFEKAARAGFKAVEYMFPYPYNINQLADILEKHGLIQALFNLPVDNWDKGERGIALLPERKNEFQEGVGRAIAYAKALSCSQLNCLVGLTPDIPGENLSDTLVSNLRFAAEALAQAKIRLLIESLNTKDIPNFHLSSTAGVLALIKDVNHPNLFYQYDVYHMQVMEGDLTETIRKNIGIIGHIFSGSSTRPDTGAL